MDTIKIEDIQCLRQSELHPTLHDHLYDVHPILRDRGEPVRLISYDDLPQNLRNQYNESISIHPTREGDMWRSERPYSIIDNAEITPGYDSGRAENVLWRVEGGLDTDRYNTFYRFPMAAFVPLPNSGESDQTERLPIVIYQRGFTSGLGGQLLIPVAPWAKEVPYAEICESELFKRAELVFETLLSTSDEVMALMAKQINISLHRRWTGGRYIYAVLGYRLDRSGID